MKQTTRDRPALEMSNELWQRALKELRLQMTKATYQAWLAHSYVIESTNLTAGLIVAVRNAYAKEWLTHHLWNVANRTVSALAGHAVTVDFVVNPFPQEDLIMLGWASQKDENFDRSSGEELVAHGAEPVTSIGSWQGRGSFQPIYLNYPKTSLLITFYSEEVETL
jgi:hypothetical protein